MSLSIKKFRLFSVNIQKKSKIEIFILAVLTICILLTFLYSFLGYKQNIQPHNLSNTNSQSYWSEQYWESVIDSSNPFDAYRLLKDISKEWAYLPTHQTLHAFGFALYKKYGIEGVNYCDDYQRFGCFHGVIASYVSNDGLSALDKIDTLCPTNQPNIQNKCFHGIGHGLVDYLGKYHLNEALNYCKKIGSMTYLGCPQGAIMEYFAPINTGSAKVKRELFNSENPFGPCSELDPEFQKYCYYFVPSFYWPDSLTSNPVEAETYCQKISSPHNQQMCIINIGVRLANKSNFNLPDSRKSCLQMNNPKNQISCTAGVKWNSGSNKDNIIVAQKLCGIFGEKAETDCQKIVDMLNN